MWFLSRVSANADFPLYGGSLFSSFSFVPQSNSGSMDQAAFVLHLKIEELLIKNNADVREGDVDNHGWQFEKFRYS